MAASNSGRIRFCLPPAIQGTLKCQSARACRALRWSGSNSRARSRAPPPHLASQIKRAKYAGTLGEPTERSCQFDMGFWNLWIDGDSRAGVLRRLKVASTSLSLIQGVGKGRDGAGKLVPGLDIGRVPLGALPIGSDGLGKGPGIVSSISRPDIGEGDGSQEHKRACEPSPAPPEQEAPGCEICCHSSTPKHTATHRTDPTNLHDPESIMHQTWRRFFR